MASKPYRLLALQYAIDEIGVHENPPGSNRGLRVDKYQETDSLTVPDHGYPWCMSFQNFIFTRAGRPLVELGRTASVAVAFQKAHDEGWIIPKTDFRAGDLALYDFPGGSSFNHVGIVRRRTSSTTFQAVEGNTSLSSDDNGGEVMDRSRSLSQVSAFVRVPGTPRVRWVLRGKNGKVYAQSFAFHPSFASNKRVLARFAGRRAGLFVTLMGKRKAPRFALVKVS